MNTKEFNEIIASAALAQHWQDVIQFWQNKTEECVPTEETYATVASAFAALGNAEDADKLLSGAMGLFPKSLFLYAEYGWLAVRTARHEEALRRWEVVLTLFPKEAVGIIGYAAALRDLRRFALADILLLGGKLRFPGSVRLATDYARIAQASGDIKEAELRWKNLIEIFPNQHVGYHGYAVLLRNIGRLDDATLVTDQGIERLPNNVDLRIFHAWLATYKQQWVEAESGWIYVRNTFPNTPSVAREIALGLGEVQMGRSLNLIDTRPSDGGDNHQYYQKTSNDDRDLENWESLGDDCEFGLVQRRQGLEPISLLRWSSTNIDQLTAAFEQDFEGVGELESTSIENHQGEYVCSNRRFGMVMHTFTRASMVERDKIQNMMSKRMRFLKRKLLEDLCIGNKIFVYKAKHRPTDEVVNQLHAAMQRHGKNRLLVAVMADKNHNAGSIRNITPTLIMGYLARFGNYPTHWDINYDGWLEICNVASRQFCKHQ